MIQTNTIERLFLEVNTSSLASAYGIRDRIDDYLSEHLLPLLENCLEEYPELDKQQINLELLSLNIDISQKDWQFELKTQWESELRKQLESQIEESAASRLLADEKQLNLEPLLHFLENGIMPWWIENPASESAMDAWIYQQLESQPLRNKLIAKLNSPAIRTRLIKQFKDGFLLSLLSNDKLKSNYWSSRKKETWNKLMKTGTTKVRTEVWELVLLLHNNHVSIPNELIKKGIVQVASTAKAGSTHTAEYLHELKLLCQQSPNPSAVKLIELIAQNQQNSSKSEEKLPQVQTDKENQAGDAKTLENGAESSTVLDRDNSKKASKDQSQQEAISQDEGKSTSDTAPLDSETKSPGTVKDPDRESDVAKGVSVAEAGMNSARDTSQSQHKEITDTPNSKNPILVTPAESNTPRAADQKTDNTDQNVENNVAAEAEFLLSEVPTTANNTIETEASQAILATGFENKSTMEQAHYMSHCGFLLIHPFLSLFLKNCELLGKNGELKDKLKAAELFYYTATGQSSAYEHQMHFFKFLCDIPQGYPLNRSFELSEDLKQKSDELLEAVLGHLPQLGSSSIDLLRNEFLCREGKLTMGKTNKVIVSRKTQDLLLQNLPWNLSIIKLPWLKKLTYLEW